MMAKLNGKTIAFIGAGKLGETLIKGMLDAGLVSAEQVVATVQHKASIERVRTKLGVETGTDNRAAVEKADIVVLAVKPQAIHALLAELHDVMTPQQVLISVVASVPLKILEAGLKNQVPVIRAMPNTPSMVNAGMTAICGGRFTEEHHLADAESIFASVGRVLRLDEKHFDAVTGLSASGPAFIYIIIESLAEGGVKAGLPRDVATELAAQTCLGAAKMVMETHQHPAVLKDLVTTPAGCTIDGILKLEEGGVRVTLIKAIVEAAGRAKTLIEDAENGSACCG